MTVFRLSMFAATASIVTLTASAQANKQLTFDADIAPIIKSYCLPCHLEENENPSELSMDNYDLLMKGGKNGSTVVPGKPATSNLYLKLLSDPPFGKQMPKTRRKLTEEEVKVVFDWIVQGARNADTR